ncbi:MAG: hypothetical protein V5A23_07835 [Halobacteriales archaeon]
MDEETANALLGFTGFLLAAMVVIGYSLNLLTVGYSVSLLGMAIASLALGVVPFERLP